MAWNRSNNTNGPKQTKGRSRFRLMLISILSIVIGVILCFLVVTSNNKECVSSKDNDGLITERISYRRTKLTGKSFVAKRESIKTHRVVKPKIEDSDVLFKPKKQGRLLVWHIRNPPVFTNQFEAYVASILTLEPGERILDTTLDDEFDKAFKEALEHPIRINPDDSEHVVALKNAVLETTDEVRKRALAGERPQDIIVDAMMELNKIADYRDQLQDAFNKYLVTETDPKEILRYRDEANAILDEYGAQHLEAPDDEEYAQEMMISAREDKIQELTEALEKSEKEK